MAVQCVLVGKGKDDVFIAVYGETTFDKVLKAYNENKVVQVIYQNRIYYLDNTTVVDSPEAFSFISAFSNQNDETGEIKHYVISLMTGDSWSGPFLQNSTPATHAKTHAKNGTDPLAPADIGAMELSENILKQSNEDITSQVAQALSKNLVPFSGGTMTGLLNVLTPVGDSNATTKKYVDDALSEKIGMDGIGDLHVWRKTVVNASEKPAGYTLGAETKKTLGLTKNNDSSSWAITVELASSVSVDDAGNVTLVSPTKRSIYAYNEFSDLFSGKFFRMYSIGSYVTESELYNNEVYFVPSGNKLILRADTSGSKFYLDLGMKLVTGYAKTPAGTTTTYPVSTNPNAYQEGSDAKPAGYTLGEVKTGSFKMGESNVSYPYLYNVSSTLAVSEDGAISIDSATSNNVRIGFGYSLTVNTLQTAIAGKFVQYVEQSGVSSTMSAPDTVPPFNTRGVIVFIPSDAKVTQSDAQYIVSKYQSVTGYPAIPAGTTIEYLGKLGDKARVQVVSYVGTGTYGEANPCSLTFDFPPKILVRIVVGGPGYSYPNAMQYRYLGAISLNGMTAEYKNYAGLSEQDDDPYSWGKLTDLGKKISWYNTHDANRQMNSSGIAYTILALV